MPSLRRALSIGILSLTTARPLLAQTEQDRSAAREFAQQADEKAAAGQIEEAIALFRKADALVPAPSLKLVIARLLVKQNKLVEAQILMLDVARSAPVALEPAPWTRARADAKAEAEALVPRLCAIEIHIQGLPEEASPKVSLDGVELPAAALGVPRVVNPGAHSVSVEVAGFKPETRKVELAEGQRQKVTVRLDPLAKEKKPPEEPKVAPPPSSVPPVEHSAPRRTRANQGLFWGGLVTLGVFSVSGAVTGLLAMQRADDLKKKCPDNLCPPSLRDDTNQAKNIATISTISFALAGAGAVMSVVGLLLREEVPPADQAALRVQVGPGGVALDGRF